MSIIESITGIFSSKKEPKKARERKAAPKSDAPKRASAGSSAAKKTGAAPAMSAHSKDAASKGKSGQPNAPAKKAAGHCRKEPRRSEVSLAFPTTLLVQHQR